MSEYPITEILKIDWRSLGANINIARITETAYPLWGAGNEEKNLRREDKLFGRISTASYWSFVETAHVPIEQESLQDHWIWTLMSIHRNIWKEGWRLWGSYQLFRLWAEPGQNTGIKYREGLSTEWWGANPEASGLLSPSTLGIWTTS